MIQTIPGLHHVTAIATDPQANIDFYTQVLGLRLVKDTVNFDDPSTYHFYYGDKSGNPGTILTFFPFVLAERHGRYSGVRGAREIPGRLDGSARRAGRRRRRTVHAFLPPNDRILRSGRVEA